MKNTKDILINVIKKCDIVFSSDKYKNCIISREVLLISFMEYLSSTLDLPDKRIGVVLNSNPLCFDIITVLFSSLYNIINSNISSDELIDTLSPGDIVCYQKNNGTVEKLKFAGKLDCDGNLSSSYIQLEKENYKTWVRKDHWHSIKPYYGNSSNLDSRGLRKKNPNVEIFFKDILEYKISDIPVEFTNSTIVVMPKEEIDQILKYTFIKFNNKTIKLLDLVTATYYTDSSQIFYSGNQTKADPVLKITNKFDIAFDLIKDNSNNSNIGFIVSGEETIKRGYTELNRLIKRKSVKNTYILAPIGYDYDKIKCLINNENVIDAFVCTKEFLNTFKSIDIVENNELTRILNCKSIAIKTQNIICETIKSIDSVKPKTFKLSLKKIKESVYENDIKDEFIVQSYSLWNLFQFAIFKMTAYNNLISKGKISATLINDRFFRLNEIAKEFPESLCEDCKIVIEQLEESYKQVEKYSKKENEVRNILKYSQSKKIALVVHKSAYRDVLREDSKFNSFDIFTPFDFIETEMYDTIVSFGNYCGNHFNPNNCFNSGELKLILFDYEIPTFYYKKKKYEEMIYHANKDSFFPICQNISNYNNNELIKANEEEKLDSELISHINDIVIKNTKIFTNGNYNSQNVEAVKIIRFSENECVAYFTKYYKACCFNPNDESIKEISVDDISEGNLILFTKNDSNTRDILDRIIQILIHSESVNEEIIHNYNLSKVWKKSLRNYIDEHSISQSKAAADLVKLGATVQPQTIKSWIDIDSQTVKPNDKINIKIIGEYTGTAELCQYTDKYFDACNIVYKLRCKIREEIKKLIVKKFKGEQISNDSILSEIENVESLYDLLTVETVFDIKENVPAVCTNRPLNI